MTRYLASVNKRHDLLEAWEKVKASAPFDVIFFEIRCKYCDSREISKYGCYKNMQRWWCKRCQRKFTDNRAAPGMKIPENRILSAISMYYKGIPTITIRRQLLDDYNYFPSESIIHRWIYRHAEKTLAYTRDHHARVGNQWMLFESSIIIGSDKLWIFDVIDFKTHFLLASRFSTNRDIEDLRTLIESAREKAGKMPDEIITKKGYLKVIEQILGPDTRRTTLKLITQYKQNDIIEYWNFVTRVRRKVMRGQKLLALARSTLQGWIFYQNYIVVQKSLKEKTASQAAAIDYRHQANLGVEEFRI